MSAELEAESEPCARGSDEGRWPHTRRAGPWLAAVLLVVLFLIPIDSSKLAIPFPADARPDRIALVLVIGLAVLAALERPRGPRDRHRYGAIEVTLVLFFAVTVLSVALNLHTLEVQAELGATTKRFAILIAFGVFYLFLVNVVRPVEVRAFIRLVVGIATIAALGTIAQYLTKFNVFFWAMDKFSPPGTTVSAYRFILLPGGRPDITGPTRHGLAISTMLAMVLPFAVVGSVHAANRRDRSLFRIAAFVILLGCLSTLRRSGVVLPFVASAAVVFLGGRSMLPVVGAFLVLLVAAPIVAPGVVTQIRAQFSSSNVTAKRSVGGRLNDYSATKPEIKAKALIGRGYGSYEAKKYRFLDNQYLGALISVGVIGVGAYLSMMVVGAVLALRLSARQRRRGEDHSVALACFGSILAFAVANALFDTLAFPQAPYAFFMVLALLAVLRREEPASVIGHPVTTRQPFHGTAI